MQEDFDVGDVLAMIDPDRNPETKDNPGWRYMLTMMICLIRWKQTDDEVKDAGTKYKNGRGYNNADSKLGVAMASYAMSDMDSLAKNLSGKEMKKYVKSFTSAPEIKGDYILIPKDLVPDAQRFVYTYRHQIVADLNKNLAQHTANEYEEKQKRRMNMTESQHSLPTIYEALEIEKKNKKKTQTQATMTSMKQWQAQQRNERIQNMKKPSVIQPKTAYKRDNKVDPED